MGMDVKYVSDCIIINRLREREIDRRFQKIKLYDYDCIQPLRSLKEIEAFQGHAIYESEIDFNLDRKLTESEIEETLCYCQNDVEELLNVFELTKENFYAQINLIKTFGLPKSAIGKTKAQLTAEIIGCEKTEHCDEWGITIVDTLKLNKYRFVRDWFMNPENHNYKKSLEIDVAGIPHVFGWGGLHGAIPNPVHRKGLLLHVDVTSFYPSMMIEYDFLTRNCNDKSAYRDIYNKRVALKKAGKSKEQAPYKIVLNSTYGICKAEGKAYDPRQANNICINGQLLLLDLIEKLENHCELIQSNTDGLIIQVEDTDEAFGAVDDICWEWEQRTRMSLGFDVISEIWQGDVNNYIFRLENGKLERKGAYVKELSDLENDLPIVNEAIVKYLTENIPVEKTICGCNDMMQFQKVVKVSGNYDHAWYNGEKLHGKCFRVFASLNPADSYIGKCKGAGATVEKFANTPEHCFIDNGIVRNKTVTDNLNKNWYINLAKKRLSEKFGVDFGDNFQLELFSSPQKKEEPKVKIKPLLDPMDIF
jgi:DNA polymerase